MHARLRIGEQANVEAAVPISKPLLDFLKLVLAFAPWITFLIVARGGLFWLKAGLLSALALSVTMGIARLHRGIILWAGLLFFAFATVAVVVFENRWTAQHMGILANAVLATSAWATVAIGKPFTLDYARDHTDPALWDAPEFIRTNGLIASIWAVVFTANAFLAWGKMIQIALPPWQYEVVSYGLLTGAAVFSVWYPDHIRRVSQPRAI
jgi:hypothetical protein